MGIGSGNFDRNGDDVKRNLGIEWEMRMLITEWEVIGAENPFPHTSNLNFLIDF